MSRKILELTNIRSINIDDTALFEVISGKRSRRSKVGNVKLEGRSEWVDIFVGTDPETQEIYRTPSGMIKLNLKPQKIRDIWDD